MEGVVTTGMEMSAVTTAITNVFGIVGTVVSEVASNPVLMLFFCAGLVGIAAGVLGRLKRI